MMPRSDGAMRADGRGCVETSSPVVNVTSPGLTQGVTGHGNRADGARMLPCMVKAGFPTIPQGLDDQGVLIAQYLKDSMLSLLDAMQSQIAHLECAVQESRSGNQPGSHGGVCDSEVAPDIRIRCATEVLHQAAPENAEMSVVSEIPNGPSDRASLMSSRSRDSSHSSNKPSVLSLQTTSNRPSVSSLQTTRSESHQFRTSETTFFESTRRDIQVHQVMKMKARMRACFTKDWKPFMLGPSKLSKVLQRRGIKTEYDLPMLENVLRVMVDVYDLVLAGEAATKPRDLASWMRAIQNNRMVATLTVSQRRLSYANGPLSGNEDGIIDLDKFIKLLLSRDMVYIVESFTNDNDIVSCIKDIQRIFFEKEAIHDVIDRLASAETSCFDLAPTCRISDLIEFLTIIVSLVAYVLEVDDQQDWSGWGVIEIFCTSALSLLIAWKIYKESLKSYLFGKMCMWNLIDTSCTAVAIGALILRLLAGGLYSVRLTIAIRLLRGFYMQTFLYVIPVLREATIMLAGFVVGLPYLFGATLLIISLTLLTGLMTKLTVGPSAGQDLTSHCGRGDDYYRSGDHSAECLLVSLYSEEFLDSVAHAMITTFRCVTGSCTTKAGLSLDLIFAEYYGVGFIFAYVGVTCAFLFGMANVVTAVCINGIHRDVQTRINLSAPSNRDVQRHLMSLKDLVREIVHVSDHDLPINLTRNELDSIMKDKRVQSILHELGVCFDNGLPAFELFDFDCDEYVKESDFYFTILKMRGSLQKADIIGAWLSLRDQREANAVNHLAIMDSQQSVYRQVQCRNAAVMMYRVDMAFEDEIHPSCGELCIVSFPGRHVFEWQGLVKLCKKGKLNSACVYLPKDDPHTRYGRHSYNPATPGSCYCWSLYGSPQEWGCKWFSKWTKQVHAAVGFGMELVVVFFEGQKDCGVQEWNKLATADLWDSVGLGGSQKGEVAWLKHNQFAFTSMDLREAVDRFQLNDPVGTRASYSSTVDRTSSASLGNESKRLSETNLKEDSSQVLAI